MRVSNLFAAATVAMMVALPSAAHPGPEPHPTVEELEEVMSEIRLAIGEGDRHLGERIDELAVRVSEPDQQPIADIIEKEVDEAVAALAQSSNELRNWVDTIAAIGAAMIAGLAGVSTLLGFQVRALRKQLSKMSQPNRAAQEVNADKTDGGEQEEEEQDPDQGIRIVTHTLKERIRPGMQPTIKELHNPDASWSPRTVAEVISDIDQGIRYVARGPKGSKAEIEVRRRGDKRHLRTKPDEHGGNNLKELPDPP